ncbi:O-antigen polymerase involved in exopolysaccharide biosynthesis [Candidatus Moduliflexus flocculans]|uniref:O-antigen polymerase involved in exopolysaccharide biosynthesis n=1 Tax=Candidatus Moduliflexus flocculans TaxID=1499966 RepID=A0A081BNC7_9BACT|nr:O-antigen polymerase involved in exopolysaccharide biosynthesis [Candidatus Moduliflexus flocculans]
MWKTLCNLFIEVGIIALIAIPPIFFGSILPSHITNIELGIFCIGVFWCIKTLLKGSLTFHSAPLDLPILLLAGLSLVNLATSVYRHQTEGSVYIFVFYTLFYFFIRQQLRTTRRIVGLTFILVLVGSGEALFGLIQYLQGATTVLGYETPNIGTVNATYFSHNHFAGLLILILPVAVGLFAGAISIEKKLFLFMLIGLMGTALVLSLSRGAFLGMGVATFGFVIFFVTKQIREGEHVWKTLMTLILIGIVCVAGITYIGFSPIAHRSLLRSFVPDAATLEKEIRFPLWRSSVQIVKDFPIFGSGLGTFEFMIDRYRPLELGQQQEAVYAHNDYLQLSTEMGIPALLLVLWGLWRFLWRMARTYFAHEDPLLSAILLGGMGSCVAIAVQSVFDFNMHIPANALLCCVIVALTTATSEFLAIGRTRVRKSRRHGHDEHREIVAEAHEDDGTFRASWRFALISLVVLFILLFHFRQPLASRDYSRGKTAHNQADFFAALPWYEKAIRLDPGNALFYESRGQLYIELAGRAPHADKWYRFALAEFRKASALNAYYAPYHYQSGWVYAMLNMEKEAIEAYREAIACEPNTAFYYEALGMYYVSLNRIEEGLNALQNAVRLDLKRLGPLITACQERGLEFERYQQLVPQEAEARKSFAEVLAAQKQWEKSKVEYRHAIELSGKSFTYYQIMLKACEQRKDVACQRELLHEMAQQQPNNLEHAFRIAETFEKEQRWDEAQQVYQTLLEAHPEDDSILNRLANLYARSGSIAQAIALHEKLVARRPTENRLYHELAELYRQRQNFSSAQNVYQRAIEAGCTQPDIYSALGQLYQQQGDEKLALEAYRKAIESGEDRFAIYQKIATLYEKQKNVIELSFLWEQYILMNKQHLENIMPLVRQYRAQGEWLKAITLMKEIVANAPTNAAYRSFLADMYEEKGMMAESLEQYERILRIQPNHQKAKQKLAQANRKRKNDESIADPPR